MSCVKNCLGIKKGSVAAEKVDENLEFIFESGAGFIREHAATQGIAISDDLEDKLYRYGVKYGLLPPRNEAEGLKYKSKVKE